MAYEVTATRRRPQTFDDLIGQEFVAATLKNSISTGQIAHAYLFSGPRGCGKTSSARLLAKALNCEKGLTADFCGKCSACTEIARGTSLDVIEIDGASNTSVNDIRQIKDEILFPPNSCRYKVYIIDEVHMLSTSAFNALLKTIEEPPPYVVFIFATTELHKVPATIKSRCQQFHFRLGSVEQIKQLLAKTAEELNIQADDEALYWIARESTGSFRDAYTLFDQIASFSDGHMTYDKIRDTLGLISVDSMNELCEICVSGDTGKAIQKNDEILQGGVSIEQFISNCADYLRSLLLVKTGITKEALLGQAATRFSANVLNAWSEVQIERGISIFLQLYRDIRYSLNPRYELELAISKLCWLSSYVSIVEVKAQIENIKGVLGGVSEPVERKALNAASPNNTVDEIHFAANFPPSSSMQKEGSHPFPASGFVQPPVQNEHTESSKNPSDDGQSVQDEVSASIEKTTKNYEKLTTEELREKLIKELSFDSDNVLLSSALQQTSNWVESNGVIKSSVESVFTLSQLQHNERTINQNIFALTGKDIHFVAELKQKEDDQQKGVVPKQVAILCDVFRGSAERHTALVQPSVQSFDVGADTNDSSSQDSFYTGEDINYSNTTEDEDEF